MKYLTASQLSGSYLGPLDIAVLGVGIWLITDTDMKMI